MLESVQARMDISPTRLKEEHQSDVSRIVDGLTEDSQIGDKPIADNPEGAQPTPNINLKQAS